MNDKIEGTITIQGLLEGELGGIAEIEKKLKDWVVLCKRLDLNFNLEINGGRFSLLAEENAVPIERLAPIPQERISELLNALAKVFSEENVQIYSTIRSVEYQPGTEIQTIYMISQTGAVHSEERTLDADTVPAKKPLTLKMKVAYTGLGAVALAIILAFSSLFVDFGDLFQQIKASFSPIKIEQIEVETGPFERYIKVAKKELNPRKRELHVTIELSDRFPFAAQAADKLLSKGDFSSAGEKLAFEALVRRYVRCEIFDTQSRFVESGEIRLKPIGQRTERIMVKIPFPPKVRPAKFKFVL
jgi:hypothetical protein